jgi:hypothetical protein
VPWLFVIQARSLPCPACEAAPLASSSERGVCLAQIMATNETAINIIDGLKGQHAQLRRLLAQRTWIKEASKATLAELENQIAQIKTVLLELEKEIQDQLKRVQ